MRKIVSFLLLISLIFSLTACSKKMEAVSSGKEGYRENTFFSNDDIKIMGDEASLPKNAVFNFGLADEGRDLSSNLLKGMEEVRKISAKSIFFFISATSEGKELQPEKPLNISFKIPDGFEKNKLSVFNIDSDGKLHLLSSVVDAKNRAVSAEISRLGLYAVAEYSENTDSESESSSSAHVGNQNNPQNTNPSGGSSAGNNHNSGFVPTLLSKDAAAIISNAYKKDDLGYHINGSFENFSGKFCYVINSGVVESSTFRATTMDVDPYALDGDLFFRTDDINKGYERTDAAIKEFFSRGYKINHIRLFYSDGRIKTVDKLPSAKEMVEQHVSMLPYYTGESTAIYIYYIVEINAPDGAPMIMMINFNGWHNVDFTIYYNDGIPTCTHSNKNYRIADQLNGTHATVCEDCNCVIEGSYENHYNLNSDLYCDKCGADERTY